MKRNPTLPPNFMLGYAIAAPNLQNYGSQGRRGLIVFTSMNFPPELQQKIEKWASNQGISAEQFVLQAIAEKIDTLSQQVTEEHTQKNSEMTNVLPLNQPNIYRKEGILVVEAELPENFDINVFIDELREERIQDQIF